MRQAEPALLQIHIFELLVLQEIDEMLTESTQQLIHHTGSDGLDLQGLVDGAGDLVVADSQFGFALFLEGEVFTQEINQLFRSLSSNSRSDDFEGDGGGFEGVESLLLKSVYFEVGYFREGLEILDLFLYLINRTVDFIKLLQLEQSVTD